MRSSHRRILVIEDESSQRLMYERAIGRLGFGVRCVADPAGAREELAAGDFAIVVLDLNLGGESGLVLFEEIRERFPAISVVIATGFGTLDAARRAIQLDVVDFLAKPVALTELATSLERAWHRHVLVQSPVEELAGTTEAGPFARLHNLRLDDVQRELVLEALRRAGDNRAAAARLLGISERSLYYQLGRIRA